MFYFCVEEQKGLTYH